MRSPEAREELEHALPRPRPLAAATGLAEREVLAHGQRREHAPALRDERDAGARQHVRAPAGQVAAVDADAAAARAQQPGDRVDERRLADAVAAEDRDRAALGQLEVDAVQDGAEPVARDQAGDLEQAHDDRPRR